MKPEMMVSLIKKKDRELKAKDEDGVTQSSIADKLGVRQSAVNQVIHKNQTSSRIQVEVYGILKEYTDESLDEFWSRKDR